MKVKGMKHAGIAGLSLLMLLAGQVTMAQAKSAQPKVRAYTGKIVHFSEKGELTLQGSKKSQKSFMIDDQTAIKEARPITNSALTPNTVVLAQGKGQHHQIILSKLTVLQDQTFKPLKKTRSGDAFGAQAKTTAIKGQIIKTEPLTIINRYHQAVELKSTDKTALLTEKKAARQALLMERKARVLYLEIDGHLQAKEIYLLPTPVKTAKAIN